MKFAAVSAALMLCTTTWVQNGYPQQYGQPGYPDPNGQYQGQPDPPSRVARISVTQGNVSLQPAGVQDFSAASLNYPMTTGDRVYTDTGSVAELEAGTLAVRMAPYTDLSVTEMTDSVAQFGLGQGSVHLRTYSIDPSSIIELDTPNVAIIVLAAGDIRVDVGPQGENTTVTLLSGAAQVQGDNFQQQLQPGETLSLTGTNPVMARDVRRPRPDGLDRFSGDRDNVFQASISANGDYLNSDTIGAEDLGSYGDWVPASDFGVVWYPRGVPADWQPYSYGHWAYVAPWGWTWVENEPWGFAPFHYGRWMVIGGRWGWIPGPRVVRPVYSPALVAFVGGGNGVTAWFPLGPREPFQPWYRTSALYVNRVNVTNIYNRNPGEVRNIYNQRNTNVYINNTTVNRVYVNRNVATVAVPQNAFASGRPVRENLMRGQPGQWSKGPVMNHPGVAPTRAIMAPMPPRGGQPNQNRPPVESRGPGQFPDGERPGNGQPNSPINRPFGNQPQQNQPAPGNNSGGDNRFNGNPANDSRRSPFGGQNPNQHGDQSSGSAPGNNHPGEPVQGQTTNNGGDNRFGGNPANDSRRAPFQGQHSNLTGSQPTGNAPGNNRPGEPVQGQPTNNGGDNRFGGNPANDSRRAPFGGQNPGQNNGQPNGGQPGNNRPTAPPQTSPAQPTNNSNGDNRFGNESRRSPFQGVTPGPLTNQPNGNAPSSNRPATPTQPAQTIQPSQPTQGNGRPDSGNPFRPGQQTPTAPQQNNNQQQNQPRQNEVPPQRQFQPNQPQPQQQQRQPAPQPQAQPQPRAPQPAPQQQPQQQHPPMQRIEKPQIPPPAPKTNN